MNPTKNDTPKVGDGATTCVFSDCNPATVTWVSPTGKTVKARGDNWKVVSGGEHDGSAEYEYSPDPNAYESTYTLRKNGRYVQKGESMRHGMRLSVGHRRRYYNPHY
jgi:hypothetical protein